MPDKLVPAGEHRAEIRVSNSRFITSIAPAASPEEARAFVQQVQTEFPDASHHVPAFIIGHGPSVTEHCQDAGEPFGSAGRPALDVLRGSGIGDAVVVVTRYFGGTKLGRGGLVRAYAEAVRAGLEELPLARKVPTRTLRLEISYALFEQTRRLAAAHGGSIAREEFAGAVTMEVRFELHAAEKFAADLRELSNGAAEPETVSENPETRLPLSR